jgi:hypothetical protein
MKRFKPLILKVWRPYLILGFMQLVSMILCSSAWQFYRHQTDALHKLRLQLSEVKIQQQTWLNQQALLNQYLPRYQTLMQSNNISQPQPQLWLRQLKHIQQSQHLFPVQYAMSKSQPYKVSFEGVQAFASNMHLEMALLHEEDLLTLLQALKASHAGGFILRSCKLNTLSGTLELQQLNPSLHAKCMLDWINILPLND